MNSPAHFTVFENDHRVATGPLAEVALVVKWMADRPGSTSILIFDDATGRPIDLDLRGSDAEVAARLRPAVSPPAPAAEPEPPRGRGRPKLGVVAREVTLLPRHWDWLSTQPGGASVALRKLVEEARRRVGQGVGQALGRHPVNGPGQVRHGVVAVRHRAVPRFAAGAHLEPDRALLGHLDHVHRLAGEIHVVAAHLAQREFGVNQAGGMLHQPRHAVALGPADLLVGGVVLAAGAAAGSGCGSGIGATRGPLDVGGTLGQETAVLCSRAGGLVGEA